MAIIDPLTLPVFPFRCPSCDKTFQKSLIDLVITSKTSCDFCGTDVVIADYYRKPEIEEFLVRQGYSGFQLGTVK